MLNAVRRDPSPRLRDFLCTVVGGAERLSAEADAIGWFERACIPLNTLPRHRARIEDVYSAREHVHLRSES